MNGYEYETESHNSNQDTTDENRARMLLESGANPSNLPNYIKIAHRLTPGSRKTVRNQECTIMHIENTVVRRYNIRYK